MRKIISLIIVLGIFALILAACNAKKAEIAPTLSQIPAENPVIAPQTPAPEPIPQPAVQETKDPIEEANDTSGLDQSIRDLDELE